MLDVLVLMGNKIITSGSGGMLVTNNFKIAKKSRHLAQQERVKMNKSRMV